MQRGRPRKNPLVETPVIETPVVENVEAQPDESVSSNSVMDAFESVEFNQPPEITVEEALKKQATARKPGRPRREGRPSSKQISGLYKFIGTNVKRIRMLNDIGQEDLAKAADIGRSSIANLERGNQRVQIHTLYLIAIALDVSVDELIPTMEQLQMAAEAQEILPFDHSIFTDDELKWMYERLASKKQDNIIGD